VLGSSARRRFGVVHNDERSTADASTRATAPWSALARGLGFSMGLGSPASLLVGATRPPLPLVVRSPEVHLGEHVLSQVHRRLLVPVTT